MAVMMNTVGVDFGIGEEQRHGLGLFGFGDEVMVIWWW
jgi:hypothetical protein